MLFHLNITSVPFFSKYNSGFNEGFSHGTNFEGPACVVEVLAFGLLGRQLLTNPVEGLEP